MSQINIDYQDQRRSKRERLAMEADVMLLRCCMVDENGRKVTKAEALQDFNFIKDNLDILQAAVLLNGFQKKRKDRRTKKSGLRIALENILEQDIIAFQKDQTPEEIAITRAAFPITPNRKVS